MGVNKSPEYFCNTYLYEEWEESLPRLRPQCHLLFHWGCLHHSDYSVLTGNAGLLVRLKLLYCRAGNGTLCMKGSLSGEKVRTPVTEDSDLMVTVNCEGDMEEYSW